MDQALGALPEEPARRRSPASCLIVLLVAAGGLLLLFMRLTPGFLRAPEQSKLTACKSHLKNLATCLELYSSDNGARYPDRLEKLIPKYLKELPTCPSSHKGYDNYQVATRPDVFSVSCVGNNHSKAYQGYTGSPENLPSYHSETGLQDHP